MALSRITNYIEADGADLNLQSSDTTITDGSVLGVINFKAPSEASGTDSILLASKIEAVAEGTFSASSNATELVFFTASSEAAGTAGGGKMVMSSTGNLTLKDTRTADGSSPSITLQTGDTDIAADDILGGIFFQAPDEATGTDAILVGAGIVAASEGDFSSSSNATSLVFRTGASATADDKFQIKSNGDLHLQTDGASFFFGASKEIELRHVADDGLILKHVGTGDGKEPSLTFQAGDNDIAQDDVLGSIFFQAPDEGAGTDAVLVAAGIEAVSEGDFSASSNATSLLFQTGASETATTKMKLTSGGNLNLITDGVVLNFGNDGDVDFTHVADKGLTLAVGGQTSSNFGTASTAADNLVVGGTGNVGISILTDANQNARVNFGDVDDTDNCQINVNNDDQSMTLVANGNDGIKIDNSADVFVVTGDLLFSASGKGVNLGVTSNTDSNTLDDYEEGSYTFAVTFEGSGTAAVSSSYNTGQYVKVGQICHSGGDMRLSSVSSPNGEMRISLPFTGINNTKRLMVGVTMTVGISAQTGHTFGGFFVRPAANEAKCSVFWQNGSSHFGLQGQNAGLGANDTVIHSLTFLVEQ